MKISNGQQMTTITSIVCFTNKNLAKHWGLMRETIDQQTRTKLLSSMWQLVPFKLEQFFGTATYLMHNGTTLLLHLEKHSVHTVSIVCMLVCISIRWLPTPSVLFHVEASSDVSTTCNVNNFVFTPRQVSQFTGFTIQSDSPHTSVRYEVHQKQIDLAVVIYFSTGCFILEISPGELYVCFFFTITTQTFQRKHWPKCSLPNVHHSACPIILHLGRM